MILIRHLKRDSLLLTLHAPRRSECSPISRRAPSVERLRAARSRIKPPHPWTAPLRNIRGQIGYDGVERIATDAVFEQLDLPPLKRTPEAAKRLKGLMVDLGWTPVRSRHVTSRGGPHGCGGMPG